MKNKIDFILTGILSTIVIILIIILIVIFVNFFDNTPSSEDGAPNLEQNNSQLETEISKNNRLFPLSTTESVYSTYSDIPEIIFSTTGAENGLSGTIYSFNGKMLDEHLDLGTSHFVVETKYGKVLMLNIYADIKDAMPVDKDCYATPEIGEEARFTCIYDGFSTVANMPAFAYGNDSLLLGSYTENDENTESTTSPTPITPTTSPEPPENQPIVYEGNGDKVITNINLDSGRYKVNVVYTGNSVFSVFGYDSDDDMVFFESSYGACNKEALLRQAKFPILLEITAKGSWKIEFEKID